MSIVSRVQVVLNGENQEVPQGATVTDVVRMLGLDGRRVAVEINREIIARSSHATHLLEDGDVLEIVHLVGGG